MIITETYLDNLQNDIMKIVETGNQTTSFDNLNSIIKQSDIKIAEQGNKIVISIGKSPNDKSIPLSSNVSSYLYAINSELDAYEKEQLKKLKDSQFKLLQKAIYHIIVKNFKQADANIGRQIRTVMTSIPSVDDKLKGNQ